MFLWLFKAYARLATLIFCRRVVINHPEWVTTSGPLSLACNRSNPFLNGIILTILLKENHMLLPRGGVLHTDHFDSNIVGVLGLAYLLYLLIAFLIIGMSLG